MPRLVRPTFAAALVMAGCASSPPPTVELARAQSAVRVADELGAEDSPQAALHVQMARDYLAVAHRRMDDDDNGEAALALRRAEADAELAISLVREAVERAKAEEIVQKVQILRREIP